MLRRLEYNVKLSRAAAPAAKGKPGVNAKRAPAALPKVAGIARGTVVETAVSRRRRGNLSPTRCAQAR